MGSVMSEHRFRIVNVFTVDGDRLSGNPLCVFEDGSGLSDAQMQALARQMNLSETTFVLPAAAAAAAATATAEPPKPTPAPPAAPAPPAPAAEPPVRRSAEAIDLLDVAGAPVANRLAPIAALVALVLVFLALRRRRR